MREAISAESTHETKTTFRAMFAAYLFMSDNANLLDVSEGCRMRRLVRYFLAKSAVTI